MTTDSKTLFHQASLHFHQALGFYFQTRVSRKSTAPVRISRAKMSWTTRVFGQASRVLMAAANSSATATATTTTIATAPKRGRPAGILKVVPVSPSLGEFLGVSEVSRTDAVKKVWEYIKHNNLQNPSNKKEILCDDKLKTIFNGKDQVGFLEIAKLLSQHFVKSS